MVLFNIAHFVCLWLLYVFQLLLCLHNILEIMKEILVQVHQIKVTQNEHGRRLTNIQNLLSNRDRNPPVNPSYSFPRQFFPLKSKESLKALEEILKDPAPKIALVILNHLFFIITSPKIKNI